MRAPSYTNQFRRDVKLAEKRGKDMAKLRLVLQLLAESKPLPERLRDHPLKGVWRDYRDLHVEPDWLLIYKVDDTSVLFARTGTHADLFDL